MNIILSAVLFFSLLFVTAKSALAVCPLCVIAVGAGLGLSRWLGIDDTVTGVWIGGFIVSFGLWFSSYIKKKKWKLTQPEIVSVLTFYLLTIIPLYFAKIIGHPLNKLWGIDKIFLGSIVGAVTFMASVFMDKYLRKISGGQVYIYYQKIILPMLLLTLVSFTFYYLT